MTKHTFVVVENPGKRECFSTPYEQEAADMAESLTRINRASGNIPVRDHSTYTVERLRR